MNTETEQEKDFIIINELLMQVARKMMAIGIDIKLVKYVTGININELKFVNAVVNWREKDNVRKCGNDRDCTDWGRN